MSEQIKQLITSESVTEGHPDKICDQISDAILDAILSQDKNARVAVETAVTTGQVHVIGEVTCEAYVEIPQIIRDTVREIGYNSADIGFDADDCGVLVSIGQQSPDIARGTGEASKESDENQGAGDQGIMYGYACDETDELFPLAPKIAHSLAEQLSIVRKNNTIEGLLPDGKTQVTIEYINSSALKVHTVLISTQHTSKWSNSDGNKGAQNELASLVNEHIVKPVLSKYADSLDITDYRYLFNPTGKFEIGGPKGDAGLTGRKIIIDTYGGVARHGGGAFSGKDPSKVDRSGAYMMRYIAKNIVAAGLAKRVELQISYAIGVPEPISIFIETFGTENYPISKIEQAVRKTFDLRPAMIIKDLDLLRPIYKQSAAYGHFGRENADFTWEKTDKAAELKAFML